MGSRRWIGLVKLEDIEVREPWNEDRLKDVREWANEETLTRIELTADGDLPRPIPLPVIGSKILNGKRITKYMIGNGVHRIIRARELGMKYILACVEDACYEKT